MAVATRVITASSVALALTACVPLPMSVYVSDSPATAVVGSSCPGNRHVPDGTRFDVAGLEQQVSLVRRHDRLEIEWRVDVPEGRTLRLHDGHVRVETRDPDERHDATFPFVSGVDHPIMRIGSTVPDIRQRQWPVDEPVVGGRLVAGWPLSSRHVWLGTTVAMPARDELWLTLPAMSVDGADVAMPTLHFVKRFVVGFALVNC